MSSNDFNGPYRPAGGRGSNRNPGGARGATWNEDGNRGGSARNAGSGYAPPEGWGEDGFWRDSAVDANYETGAHRALGNPRSGGAGAGVPGRLNPPGGAGPAPTSTDMTALGDSPGRDYRISGRAAVQGGYGDATRVGDASGAATRADRVPGGMRGAGVGAAAGAGAGRMGGPAGPGGRGPGGPRPGGPGGRGPGGPRRPGYGDAFREDASDSWWRNWTMKKALKVGSLSSLGGLVLIAIVGFIMYSMTTVPTQAAADVTMQNSTVFYNDGKTLVGSFGSMHRQNLNFNQIPKATQDAVLAAEERGFWHDSAVSPTGMMRAAYDDVMSGGGSLSGGSTITQEFVRNYYANVGTQQTMSRKIKEIFIAMKLGQSKSKQWILTNYLNTIYLGEDSYGVGAAAETYFGVPAEKLNVAQSAVIAAIIQQPSTYPLPQYRPQLVARWHYVLNGMVKMGDLTAAKAASMKFPTMLPAGSQYSGSKPWDGYIMQQVAGELKAYDHISQQQLDSGGYRINLTVSQQSEQALYDAVNKNIAKIKAEGYNIQPWALIGAQAENPANGAIEAIYGGPGENQSQAQCAADYCDENTTLTGEQVGSSFKPYTLSAAVKQGMNVRTSLLNGNTPLWVPPFGSGTTMSSRKPMPPSSGYHKFTNDANEQLGPINVQTALAKSSNTAFTDLAHRVGLKPIEQMAEAMGGVDPSSFAGEYGVGITLGQDSLTVNNQASMLATIDDGGVYHQAHLISSYSNSQVGTKKQPVKTDVALSKAEASQVQYAMLKTDSAEGTAPAAAMTDGRPIISKTGTTTGSKSAFYIGGIPQDVLAVGIFTAKQSNTNNNQTLTGLGGGGFGGSWPASIWHDYAESQWASQPIVNFPNPIFSGQMWRQVPKPPPPPKPKPKPTPTAPGKQNQPCKPGGGGLFGNGNGNANGNCQQTTAPTGAPSPTQTAPSQQCSGGLFNSCPSTPAASATPTSGGGAGGNKPGG